MHWGYNVWITFFFRIFDGVATGIWSSSVLSNYISVQQGSERGTQMVGIAQAVQGTFLVAAAIPGAWLASHFRRDLILKFMGLVAFAAIASTTSALMYYEGNEQYIRLCVSLALWGVAQANAPVLDALFADSVTTGGRTVLYTRLHICYILSQGLGPAVAALVFYIEGDEWSTERLRLVMLCGMGLAVIPACLLLMFDDDKALGEESEGLLKVLGHGGVGSARTSASGVENDNRQPLLGPEERSDDKRGDGIRRWDEELGRSSYVTDNEHDLEGFDDVLCHSPAGGDNLFSTSLSPPQSQGPMHNTVTATASGMTMHQLLVVEPHTSDNSPQQDTSKGQSPLILPAFSPSLDMQLQPEDQGSPDPIVPEPDSHAIALSDGSATHYSSEYERSMSVASTPAKPPLGQSAFRQLSLGTVQGGVGGEGIAQSEEGPSTTAGGVFSRHSRNRSLDGYHNHWMPTLDEEGTDASGLTPPDYNELGLFAINSEAIAGRITSSSAGPVPTMLRNNSLVAASTTSLGDWLPSLRSGMTDISLPSPTTSTQPQPPSPLSPQRRMQQSAGLHASRANRSALGLTRHAPSSGLGSTGSLSGGGGGGATREGMPPIHDQEASELQSGTSSGATTPMGYPEGGAMDDPTFQRDSGQVSSITFGTLPSSLPFGTLPSSMAFSGGVQGSGGSINLATAMGGGGLRTLQGPEGGGLRSTPHPNTSASPRQGASKASPTRMSSGAVGSGGAQGHSAGSPQPPPQAPARHSLSADPSSYPRRSTDQTTPPSSLLTGAFAALGSSSLSGKLATPHNNMNMIGEETDASNNLQASLLERHLATSTATAAGVVRGYGSDRLVGMAEVMNTTAFTGFSTFVSSQHESADSPGLESSEGMAQDERGSNQSVVRQGRMLAQLPWAGTPGGAAMAINHDSSTAQGDPPPRLSGGGGERQVRRSSDIQRRRSGGPSRVTTPSLVQETVRRLQARDAVGIPGRMTSVRQLREAHRWGCLDMNAIPGIVALTDCIMGLASGMTIKFFPIFFRQAVGLSPVYVNLMYCAVPLCLSLAAAMAQKESTIIGRVQTMIVNRAVGIVLLFWMAYFIDLWQRPHIMVPVYILRTSIMNANYPIQRALLMDYVPKEHRAKWNSLESVTSFGWSGSAAVGGWLINTYGFQLTFFITAIMQLMAWLCSMLLLPIVPWHDLTPQMLTAPAPGSIKSVRSSADGTSSRMGAAGGGSFRKRARRVARRKK